MCISPLTPELLGNMKKFKYVSTDDSLLYNKCMSPCLNKVVLFIPTCIAPNLITLFSLMCNFIAALITYLDAGFDFGRPLKHHTCFIIGCTQLLYQILDNLDGKQARRTGTASPFGMLMDHGCDIFTNILTSFNVSHLFLVGNEDIYNFTVFFGLTVGFYMMTYEQYRVGELHFPIINGTDEGNMSIFLLGVVTGFIGQNFLEIVLFQKNFLGTHITIGKILGLGIALGGISTIFNLYLHTCQKKKASDMLYNFLDALVFYNSFIIPILFIIFRFEFYQKYIALILINAMGIFARVTLDLQVKIATMDSLGCNFIFILSNLVYMVSFFFPINLISFYLLIALAAVQFSELAMFIYLRANEITNYLGIKIFVVSRMDQL